MYSVVGKKRALILVGLSVLRFELDLVLYVVIWTQCSLFLFGLDVHCFGLSMPARFFSKNDIFTNLSLTLIKGDIVAVI